ncbi:MAG: hypothetical protein H8D56_22020 [Planctomycetes bacterium]|nr:hypothetical protein [Planctomycetota bacterium]MBL7146961.1 hypothetical protein [Phycisphaerae bacterium]
MNKGQHHVKSILVLAAFVYPLTIAQSTPDTSLGRQLFLDGKYQEAIDN